MMTSDELTITERNALPYADAQELKTWLETGDA